MLEGGMIAQLMSELVAEYRPILPTALIQINSTCTVSFEAAVQTDEGPTTRRLTLEFDAQGVKAYGHSDCNTAYRLKAHWTYDAAKSFGAVANYYICLSDPDGLESLRSWVVGFFAWSGNSRDYRLENDR